MGNNTEGYAHSITNTKNVMIGMLIGSLTGAVSMLLYAPQSGERTRATIRRKSIQFRDQTVKKLKRTVAEVRSETDKLMVEGREKAEDLVKQFSHD